MYTMFFGCVKLVVFEVALFLLLMIYFSIVRHKGMGSGHLERAHE